MICSQNHNYIAKLQLYSMDGTTHTPADLDVHEPVVIAQQLACVVQLVERCTAVVGWQSGGFSPLLHDARFAVKGEKVETFFSLVCF